MCGCCSRLFRGRTRGLRRFQLCQCLWPQKLRRSGAQALPSQAVKTVDNRRSSDSRSSSSSTFQITQLKTVDRPSSVVHCQSSGMAAKSASLAKEDTKTEHPLQAIVLCDAWGEEERWGPLVRRKRTDEEEYDDITVTGEQRPWCLLPLLGSPLLAWTLESLSTDGVDQVFLFVREGADQVRAWLASSAYTQPHSSITITLRPTKASTPGDVLREVDSLQILAPADFLVVQAGYIGNINLKTQVADFASRRTSDPNASMSCVIAPVGKRTSPTYAVHALSSECQLVHYEQSPLFPSLRKARLPRATLESGKDVSLRCDLESVGVAICSVEVPPLFTENFDYQFFYPDFVNGILTSDLLGKTIYATVVGEETVSVGASPSATAAASQPSGRRKAFWAGVVGNTRSYDAVSRAIISRKAYPLAPDEFLPESRPRFEQRRARVYHGHDVDLSRSCQILSSSLLGSSTCIGDASFVTYSVLGDGVRIGANTVVTGSHLFGGVQIGDDCIVKDTIIGEHSIIGNGSVLEGGCLIAAGLILGEITRLKAGARVSLEKPPHSVDPGENYLGPSSTGYLWPSEDVDADVESPEEEFYASDSRNLSIMSLGRSLSRLSLHSSTSSLSSLSRASSSTSLSTLQHGIEIQGISSLTSSATTTTTDFVSECVQSLERSFSEQHTVENAAIELKTLRMASNVPLSRVRDVVIPFMLRRCGNTQQVSDFLSRWGGLLANLTADQEEGMIDSILIAQKWVAEQVEDEREALRLWLRILKAFYETDVIDDESVLEWYKSVEARSIGGELGRNLWAGSRPFLEALAEDSDEESSEDLDDR